MKPATFNQLAAAAHIKAGSQKDAIAKLLFDRWGAWVSLPDLGKASGSRAISALIANLRHRGLHIRNKLRNDPREADRMSKHSWYRLEDFTPGQSATAPKDE